jgi:hypothetical protein
MGSCFDALEDQDADDVISNLVKLSGKEPSKTEFGVKNSAFIFIKPHAVNDKVINYVKEALKSAKISILKEGQIDGKKIDDDKLIDVHYGAIAAKAMF